MLYKSLILGVLFSIGVFAAKSGVGILYCVSGMEKKRAKAGAFLLFAVTYFLVFAAAALILERIDPVRHLAAIQSFIQSGMIIHLIMAALMMAWGAMLLKKSNGSRLKSKGWLMLAAPCPVCAIVIFFSAAFLIACFPDAPKTVVALLYLVFVLINLIAMVLVIALQRKRQSSPESFLGGAMMLMALYFFVSVTVMPNFADVDKIYRMACNQTGKSAKEALYIAPFSVLAATAFAGGYGLKFKKIRSVK